MKIDISVNHYGPTSNCLTFSDQSQIWVNIKGSDEEHRGSGYINNIFPTNHFGDGIEDFKKQTLPGTIVKTVYMEKCNGGRDNPNVYNSIEEYVADPAVKRRCHRFMTDRTNYFSTNGDPEYVDAIHTFKFDNHPLEFTLSYPIWKSIIPQEWYNEFHADIIEKLSKSETWENADVAIHNTEVTDDLFGNRLFPVLKAPVKKLNKMKNICKNFKNCSKPLTDDKFVYIGIRSKPNEIDTIRDIYLAGGCILQNQSWDW